MASNASGNGNGVGANSRCCCAACACAYAILIKRRKATASGFGRREMEDGTRDTHDGIDLLSPPTVGYLDLQCGISREQLVHHSGPQWSTVGHMSPLCLLISSYCCLASTSVRHKLNFAASAVLDGPQWLPHVVACHWLLLQDNGRAASTLSCAAPLSLLGAAASIIICKFTPCTA